MISGAVKVLVILNFLTFIYSASSWQTKRNQTMDPNWHQASSPVPVFKTRADLAGILERERFSTGVELGVQRGEYSKVILATWKACTKYVLVDLWATQKNYTDAANVHQAEQDENMKIALENLKQWQSVIMICRNYTTYCAIQFPVHFFDFVYVDARHDRLGVTVDLDDWWPKVRRNGLMCGHDFVTQDDGPQQGRQDWTKNYDGSIDHSRQVPAVCNSYIGLVNLHVFLLYLYMLGGVWSSCRFCNVCSSSDSSFISRSSMEHVVHQEIGIING